MSVAHPASVFFPLGHRARAHQHRTYSPCWALFWPASIDSSRRALLRHYAASTWRQHSFALFAAPLHLLPISLVSHASSASAALLATTNAAAPLRPNRRCQGTVPQVPQATGYSPNRSGHGPVPSSGTWLGNPIPCAKYDLTTPSLRWGTTNLKRTKPGGGQDFATCQPNLNLRSRPNWACTRALSSHAQGILSTGQGAREPETSDNDAI
jgi:hypothetical protein